MHQVTGAPTPPLRPKEHASRPRALRARSGPRRDIGVDLAFLRLPAKRSRGRLPSRANQTGTFGMNGTRQRSGPSHRFQCALLRLRIAVVPAVRPSQLGRSGGGGRLLRLFSRGLNAVIDAWLGSIRAGRLRIRQAERFGDFPERTRCGGHRVPYEQVLQVMRVALRTPPQHDRTPT